MTAPLSTQTEKERDLLREGARKGYMQAEVEMGEVPNEARAIDVAKALYPEHREIDTEHGQFRVVDGVIEYKYAYGFGESGAYTAKLIRALYDLLENPTEVSHG